jgi:hypothetical protein
MHLEMQPSYTAKLQQIIKSQETENKKATHKDDTIRLVTEIEMLKIMLYLVNRNNDNRTKAS